MRIKCFEKKLLYSIISLGFLIRIYHHYNWRIWGSDSGEYLYLTRYLVRNGQMITEGYIGWGRAYPDFQGMQILAGTISLLTKIDYNNSLLLQYALAERFASITRAWKRNPILKAYPLNLKPPAWLLPHSSWHSCRCSTASVSFSESSPW